MVIRIALKERDSSYFNFQKNHFEKQHTFSLSLSQGTHFHYIFLLEITNFFCFVLFESILLEFDHYVFILHNEFSKDSIKKHNKIKHMFYIRLIIEKQIFFIIILFYKWEFIYILTHASVYEKVFVSY